VEVIPDDEMGQVSIQALEEMLDDRVKLIAITHVPTNGGLVNPVVEIGKLARNAQAYYLVDACQSIGQMPVDVNEVACDMLSTTSRKFVRGPRGVGFLYVRKECIKDLEPPLLDLHSATWVEADRYEIRPDARRFENWETNYAAKIGMGTAIDYAMDWGVERIWKRINNLAAVFRKRLLDVSGITLHDKGVELCGIITFTHDRIGAQEIQQALRSRDINVTVSSRDSTRMDMEARDLTELVRASVHYYNTETEIEDFCTALSEISSLS
ncbi:MAG: aminotransferase class V-fold PLP-dependent enzyme, partial [Anaerolineaceae bacterium]|nr:aminotransferase class V-fold PLP-dependent enzyme [Anaerolineaceae bacterium]